MSTESSRIGRIARVLAAVVGVPERNVTERTTQTSVEGWDSLVHIHLVAALEAEFNVSFTTDEAIDMTSVAAICTALAAHGVSGTD